MHQEIQGRPHEDRGRDWGDAATSQTPKSAGNHQKLEEAKTDLFLEPSEEPGPADTLILDSSLQDCERLNSCCFKTPVICGSMLQHP